jgi:hypothetical protein
MFLTCFIFPHHTLCVHILHESFAMQYSFPTRLTSHILMLGVPLGTPHRNMQFCRISLLSGLENDVSILSLLQCTFATLFLVSFAHMVHWWIQKPANRFLCPRIGRQQSMFWISFKMAICLIHLAYHFILLLVWTKKLVGFLYIDVHEGPMQQKEESTSIFEHASPSVEHQFAMSML